jgi:ABC-type branched-subunit amino acid transport system substrate-binding protein
MVSVRRVLLLATAVAASVLAGCGSDSAPAGGTLLIAVDAPFSTGSYIGKTIANGAQLAVDEINAQGGIVSGGRTYRLKVKRYDNAQSVRRAVANVRRALDDDAIAIVDDGTAVDASWQLARDAHVPIDITYGGGRGLVDEEARPNVFRIAPTDRGLSFRLAEYLIPKGLKIALLHDDTPYGQDGGDALDHAFSSNPEAVATRLTLPGGDTDLSPQILRARRAGATALLVWGEGATIAETVIAARSAGWDVPIYAPPSAEEPILRQQLADRPEWLDGLTFASGRMTAELGPGFFYAFQSKYEAAYGVQRVGVRTKAGQEVVAPPDYAMYSYDFVNVLAAALRQAGTSGEKLVKALEQVTVRGANGDERGFNEHNHEGVVDDDVYFARFRDMTFHPVKDDPLSATLPTVSQVR